MHPSLAIRNKFTGNLGTGAPVGIDTPTEEAHNGSDWEERSQDEVHDRSTSKFHTILFVEAWLFFLDDHCALVWDRGRCWGRSCWLALCRQCNACFGNLSGVVDESLRCLSAQGIPGVCGCCPSCTLALPNCSSQVLAHSRK